MSKQHKIILLLVLLLSVSVYMNSIYGDFLLDDEALIQKNPAIRHFSMDLLTYRLVRTLSYAVDYHFWGLNPLGYHLSNLLYNTLTVLAVFFLTRRLTGIFLVSVSTALLFAVHPIHAEAVSYLSGRRDILTTLFYFLGLLSYIKARQERIPWMYGLVMLCYAAGILSKEMAVTLPVVIFAYEVILWIESHSEEQGLPVSLLWHAVRDTGKRSRWVIFSSMLFVLGYLYVIIFLQKASALVRADRFLWWGGNPVANFATVSRVIMTYIRKLFFPVVLQVDYHQFPYSRTFFDLRVLSACTVIISLMVISVILFRRHRLLAFSIWWFFITLIPVMQIIPHHILMAEHYLYLPSYGFCLALSLLSYRIYQRANVRILLLVCAASLLTLYSIRTVVRNQDWQDIVILMKEGLKHNPGNPLYHFFLGRTYGLYKLYPSADKELAQSIGSRHDYSDIHSTKALVAFQQGDYEKGMQETEESLKRKPDNQMVLYNMGFYADEMGDDQAALGYYLKVAPDYESGNALLKIATLYMKAGDLKRAEESLVRLMKMQPRNSAVYFGLAEVYTKDLRFDEAIQLYHEVLKEPGKMSYRMDDEEKKVDIPRVQESLEYVNALKEKRRMAMIALKQWKSSDGHRILAEIYLTVGNLNMAEKELKESMNASDDTTKTELLLGDVYQKMGKDQEAEETYTRLLQDKKSAPLNVLSGAGTFYAKTLRFKEASELFRVAEKRNPGNSKIRDDLNWSIKLEKLSENSEQLKRSSHPVDAALIKADVYVSVDKKQDAIRELEHALEVESENRALLKALASLYETQGYSYWKKTIGTYRSLLSLNENDADTWRRLGEFYYTVIQDYESALICFEKSLSVKPEQDGVEQIKATIEKLQQYVKLHLGESG